VAKKVKKKSKADKLEMAKKAAEKKKFSDWLRKNYPSIAPRKSKYSPWYRPVQGGGCSGK